MTKRLFLTILYACVIMGVCQGLAFLLGRLTGANLAAIAESADRAMTEAALILGCWLLAGRVVAKLEGGQ